MHDAAELPAVIVAGQSAGVRAQWLAALGGRSSVTEVGEFGTLERTLAAADAGVLVLDLALPGLGRVEGLGRLAAGSPRTRIIALTDHETEDEGMRALVAGARGYYDRSIDSALLAKAVRAVGSGELWVKRVLVNAVVAALVAQAQESRAEARAKLDRQRLDRLTHRQREVAAAIACGASNKEIASRLNVTERTVKAHITEMFRNVGVFDRLRLALLLNDVPSAMNDDRTGDVPVAVGSAPRRRANRLAVADGVDVSASE